jgi:hypothetical protein
MVGTRRQRRFEDDEDSPGAVPGAVAEADLGYEYLKAKWISEDDRRGNRKRRIAQAMQEEIEERCRKKQDKVVSEIRRRHRLYRQQNGGN